MTIDVPSGSRNRILLVESFLPLRICLKEFLESAGPFQVVAESQGGNEALARLSQIAPDLVVIHVNSNPAKDLEFIQAVHRFSPPIVIVALSLDGDEYYFQRKCYDAGAWACLPMPCRLEAFQQTLQDCCMKSSQESCYPR